MTVRLDGLLVLVGAGKMGGAMLEGWLAGGIAAENVAVLDPAPPEETAALLKTRGIRLNAAISSLKNVEALVVAVKPQLMNEVLPPLAPLAGGKPLILSIAAGKTIASFERHFGKDAAVVRTIPNTPAAIRRGITAMVANGNVSDRQYALARALLESIGEVIALPEESMIDAVTALSGSGPAYIFYLTECLAAAGEKLGIPAEISVQLARATVSGAGELMRVTGLPAATLRQNVTSPKGTTHAALEILMAKQGLQPLLDEALRAARDRARELAS
jgi:pyrroline-5-carboxylate reductase